MFAKEIILEEQLAARCLFQCSVDRKLPANAGTLDIEGLPEVGVGIPTLSKVGKEWGHLQLE